MQLSDTTVRIVARTAAVIFTPLVILVLSRLAPPRGAERAAVESLRAKYEKVVFCSGIAFFVGMLSAIFFCVSLRKNSIWMMGVLFGWMVAFPVLLIAIRTLRYGRQEWNDFWFFYEMKYKVGVRLIFLFYGFLIAVGVISTVALY